MKGWEIYMDIGEVSTLVLSRLAPNSTMAALSAIYQLEHLDTM